MGDDVTVELAVGTRLDEGPPKKRKGCTTSVSIMTIAGVKRMGKAWVVLPSDAELLAGLCKRTDFDHGLPDVENMTSLLPDDARTILRHSVAER